MSVAAAAGLAYHRSIVWPYSGGDHRALATLLRVSSLQSCCGPRYPRPLSFIDLNNYRDCFFEGVHDEFKEL